MRPSRLDIPPHVAEVIRSLHPDLRRPVKSAIRAIATDPECGEPLLRELDGFRKYRVRRFRIVYAIDRKARVIRLMAVGHRRNVYEDLAAGEGDLRPSAHPRIVQDEPAGSVGQDDRGNRGRRRLRRTAECAAAMSRERGAELFDGDPRGADELAQRPGRQSAMVRDRERGDGARFREDHVATGLAAKDPPAPLEGPACIPAADDRQLRQRRRPLRPCGR